MNKKTHQLLSVIHFSGGVLSGFALNNWKAFVDKFLSHKNPYTGMTLAENPCLFYIGLINELPYHNQFDRYSKAKEIGLKAIADWKQETVKNSKAAYMVYEIIR